MAQNKIGLQFNASYSINSLCKLYSVHPDFAMTLNKVRYNFVLLAMGYIYMCVKAKKVSV